MNLRNTALALVPFTVGATLAVAIVASAPAQASVIHSHGLMVDVPTYRTSYNHARVKITPTVHVESGAHNVIKHKTIGLFSGSHRIASGSSVRVPVGRYTERVTVGYRTYKNVTTTKTVKVKHDPDDLADYPGTANHVNCLITAVDGSGDDVSGTCTTTDYPAQTINITNDYLAFCGSTNGDAPVGQYDKNNICYYDPPTAKQDFHPYYTTKTVPTTKRVYTGYRHYVTPKRLLVIKQGGAWWRAYDDQALTTNYVTVPAGARIYYSFSESDGYTCASSLWAHTKGTPSYEDQLLNNVIRYSGSFSWHFTKYGTYRFDVLTDCSWRISIRWKY